MATDGDNLKVLEQEVATLSQLSAVERKIDALNELLKEVPQMLTTIAKQNEEILSKSGKTTATLG